MKKRHVWISLKICLLFGLVMLTGLAVAAPESSPWGESYFPNITLTNQEGKKVNFYHDLIKNKVVAFNFIFTHCADACPMETANMSKIQKALGDRIGRDVFLYSISIKPEEDTPAELKAYAEKFGAKPGWQFLTGNKDDIKLLRQKFGLYNEDESQSLSAHSISMMVGNEATGQWMKRSAFDEPKVLARILGTSLQTKMSVDDFSQNNSIASYRDATVLQHFSKGEALFRSRCDSCHSLSTEAELGPGLAGVTKHRDHDWLVKWLKAPNKMLKKKDPLAIALFQANKQMIMPNLRLTNQEVKDILAYLEDVDRLSMQ